MNNGKQKVEMPSFLVLDFVTEKLGIIINQI
uniref:Uncharacterized protein n=1 Tax=Anguilla anguilla TaxID=7936 RepID=A0A0E9T4F0_ANGAN